VIGGAASLGLPAPIVAVPNSVGSAHHHEHSLATQGSARAAGKVCVVPAARPLGPSGAPPSASESQSTREPSTMRSQPPRRRAKPRPSGSEHATSRCPFVCTCIGIGRASARSGGEEIGARHGARARDGVPCPLVDLRRGTHLPGTHCLPRIHLLRPGCCLDGISSSRRPDGTSVADQGEADHGRSV
jgi:hypothetical protein